jgi:putative addiction module component (TIGR02574 family)
MDRVRLATPDAERGAGIMTTKVKLPLDTMSVEEKLATIEEIWESLAANPDDIPSPAWHRDILEARLRDTEDGWDDLETAMENVRKKIK